ncbi:MAG: hypothetical protein KIS79_17550, partial [Burkholderiales bacterium]|nr:hypothetical protein [Burkholderiales bacterium]
GRAARRMGLFHMLSGLLATALMAASVALRWFDSLVSPLAILIAGTGLIALVVSVALGLYMVHVLAVGVSTETEELVTEVPASAHGTRDRRSRVAARGALPRRQHHPGH